MASPYDQSLLASAPAATREQMQHGYNLDLATEKPVAPTPPASNSRADLEAYPGGHTPSPLPPAPQSYAPKTPWYRTKKGILILIVALVIVIAAVVGGAVGGTRKKSTPVAAADQQVGGAGGGAVGVGSGNSTTGTGNSTTSSVILGSERNTAAPASSTTPSIPEVVQPVAADPSITTSPNQNHTDPLAQLGVSF